MSERSDLAKIALAAWVNVRPDQLPAEKMWIEHPNDENRKAWDRVIHAILAEARRVAVEAALTNKGYPTMQSELVGHALDEMMHEVQP